MFVLNALKPKHTAVFKRQPKNRLEAELDDWLDPSLPMESFAPVEETASEAMEHFAPEFPDSDDQDPNVIGDSYTDANPKFRNTTLQPRFVPVLQGNVVRLIHAE
jgi:hypothetical protein